MSSRFLKSYETSFQANIIDSLRKLSKNEDYESFNLIMTKEQAGLSKIFSESLGVTARSYIQTVMEAELARMMNIKKRNASLEEQNNFYGEIIIAPLKAEQELDGLVANYLPINLSQLQNALLIKQAKLKLGLRFNNFRAYRLANFDGKPTIEIVLYIDNEASKNFRSAWLGVKGLPLKSLSFCSVSSLSEHVNQVSIFANLFDLNYMHVGQRGLRYER